MSNAEVTQEKHRVVGIPWKPGQSGNPNGRPRGSRNKLADAFLVDVHDAWELHGRDALERVARDEPEVLLKLVASLMPKDVAVSVTGSLDVGDFTTRFRTAISLLHDGPPPQPTMRTIEHKATSNARKPA